jgi:hypothetical protein
MRHNFSDAFTSSMLLFSFMTVLCIVVVLLYV